MNPELNSTAKATAGATAGATDGVAVGAVAGAMDDTATETAAGTATEVAEKTTVETEVLHKKFVLLGRQRNRLTYELCALLPQIYRQRIYEKKGYLTIYEYAGKLAGLSDTVVRKTLGLEKKLEGKPFLQKAIETQGVHKVAIVAQLATPETDADWADKVANMNKGDLQELSKEMRGKKTLLEMGDTHCCAVQKMTIELDDEAQYLFLKLKKKFGEALSNKDVLKKILKMLEGAVNRTTSPQKRRKVQKIPGDFRDKKQKRVSKYVSTDRRRVVAARQHGRCAYPGCNKPIEVFHHPEPFSKNQSHDGIIGLCKTHHNFTHNGLVANQTAKPCEWELRVGLDSLSETDLLFRKYRRAALDGAGIP